MRSLVFVTSSEYQWKIALLLIYNMFDILPSFFVDSQRAIRLSPALLAAHIYLLEWRLWPDLPWLWRGALEAFFSDPLCRRLLGVAGVAYESRASSSAEVSGSWTRYVFGLLYVHESKVEDSVCKNSAPAEDSGSSTGPVTCEPKARESGGSYSETES